MGTLAACSGGASGSSSAAASADSASPTAASAEAASAAASQISIPEDFTSTTRAFLVADEEDYAEFIIAYEGNDTGALMAISDMAFMFKESGYDLDTIEAVFDPDQTYPGFSTLDFTSTSIEEKSTFEFGDCIVVTCKFEDLKNIENLLKLDDLGLLTLENRNVDYVSAQSFADLMISSGATEIDRDKFVTYGIPLM